MRSSTSYRRLVTTVLASSMLVGGIALAGVPATASDGADNSPPFDFTDSFYRANGVKPSALVGRRNGTDGTSVVDTAPDANHRNVRATLTLPAYNDSGGIEYFTVLADLAQRPFTANAAGRAARTLAEASPVYVFPTLDGDPLAVNNNRQADLVDMRHGYFSNNPLGLWVHVFVTWTPAAFNTAQGRAELEELTDRNGSSLDGTPIIKTLSELRDLSEMGLVDKNRRPRTSVGRWFVCPVIEDPRDGGIAADAFLATVRRSDGTPLPAERAFVTHFESLQTTGDWADE